MPTEGNIYYRCRAERDGRTIHVVTVDDRTFQVVAASMTEAIRIAMQAHAN